MKDVYIVHNSKFGNSEKLSNEIATGLKDKFDVKVGNIKEIQPDKIVADKPEALIIGARIIAFNVDRTMTKYIKKLGAKFEGQIPKIATFYTHAASWTDKFARGMSKALNNTTCVGDLCPEILEVQMASQKGPAKEGQDEKIQNYIKMLMEFIGE